MKNSGNNQRLSRGRHKTGVANSTFVQRTAAQIGGIVKELLELREMIG